MPQNHEQSLITKQNNLSPFLKASHNAFIFCVCALLTHSHVHSGPKALITHTETTKDLSTRFSMFCWLVVIVLMAFNSSIPQIPETEEKEDQEFDLLQSSEVEVGVKEEDLNLPMGYRFSPDVYELVVFYLSNKILGRVLPITNVVKEVDLYEHHPTQLPVDDFRHGDNGNEAFYFTYIKQIYSKKGKITKRTTRGGYWKVTGEEEEIPDRKSDIIVGFEKTLAFYQGQPPNGIESSFEMYEYRLNPSIVPVHILNDSIRAKIERCVLCRIINKNAVPRRTFELPPELLGRIEDESLGCVEDGEPK